MNERRATDRQASLRNYIKLYLILIRTSVRSRMQYRFNFAFGTVLAAIIQLSEFLMIAIVLAKFGAVRGWTMHEVGYLFAVMTLAKTLYRTFGNEVHNLERYLVEGELDQLLTKPLPVLLSLLPRGFRIMFGEVIQGGAILAWSLGQMLHSGQISWWAIPQTIFAIVTGGVVLFAIGMATATCGFWTTRISMLQNMTEDAAQTAARYPLTLYPGWMSGLLLTAIPVGLVGYLPALYILRGELGLWVFPVLAAASCLVVLLALRFWKFGISKYQSTGS
ncbi:ABC transporter permease [Saccharibacillus endophyticus]|uniref:ABC transporter permease n=1 Tax=Saccharibacillus endophyticus TaxID=2060666 RepID=A0ABQ1ZU85_9BACL|nr:ABC-2 family transporter protein [Saccharibacillus endophyticus]GGH77318.1 ABC transporter permease [Saccharibacillus endophyticus]